MGPKRVCQVPFCGNFKVFKQTPIRDDLFFFGIPKDRVIQWTEAIGRPDLVSSKTRFGSYHVCSDHFREEDYLPNVLNTVFNQKFKRRLKLDAVPSLLLPTPEQIQKASAERKRKKLIKSAAESRKLDVKVKRIDPIINIQRKNPCLICSEEIDSPTTITSKPGSNYQLAGSSQSNLLNEQLWSTFILRKIIQLPVWKFGEILRNAGLSVHPGKWFVLCDTCTQTVVNIMEIQDNIYQLELKVKELINKMRFKFESSLEEKRGNDDGEMGEMDITKEIRQFFKDSTAEPQPKLEVDMTTQDAVDDSEDNRSNMDDDEEFKVESEGDESETSLRDDDDDYENAEDEDWIPTPNWKQAEKGGDDDVDMLDPLADRVKDDFTVPELKLVESTTKFRKGIPERVYKCHLCPKEYFTLSLIKNHYELHSRIRRVGNGRTECSKCGIPFQKAKTLRTHLQLDHQITLDPSWDDTNESQEEYISRTTGGKVYRCKICPREYSIEHQLVHHIQLHEKSKLVNNGRYDCSICSAPYEKAVSVQCHIKNVHGMTLHQLWDKSGEPQKEFLYTSKTKKKVISRLKEKGYDIYGVLGTPKGPRVLEAKYQCPICPRKLTKKGFLDKHIEYHERTKSKYNGKFDCARCGVPFTNHKNLRVHYSEQHKLLLDTKWRGEEETGQEDFLSDLDAPRPSKPKRKQKGPNASNISSEDDKAKLKCPKCDVLCKSQVGLTNHLKRRHKMERTPAVCELCGFVVDSIHKKKEIEAHMLTHKIYDNSVDPSVSTTDFVCNLCNKLFSTRRDFRSHKLATHAEELGLKVHKCSYCPQVFPRNHNRMFHELRIHKKKGLYPCDQCDYEAVSRLNLELHMAKHSKFKQVCEYCSATYKSINGFREHIRRFHPDKYVGKKRLKFSGVPVETLASVEGDQPLLSISRRKKQMLQKEVNCKYCDAVLPHHLGLKMHLEEVHKDMYKYRCNLCEKVYMSLASLNLHKKINHKEKGKTVRCGWCFKLVAHRISLYDHRKRCQKRPKQSDGQVVPKIMPVAEESVEGEGVEQADEHERLE